jgi:hypothetical protein
VPVLLRTKCAGLLRSAPATSVCLRKPMSVFEAVRGAADNTTTRKERQYRKQEQELARQQLNLLRTYRRLWKACKQLKKCAQRGRTA